MPKPAPLIEIGSQVSVNIGRVRDRVSPLLLELLSDNPSGRVLDYKMTDGRGGIGVVIKMNDGSKHWFFEDEVS